MQLFKKSKERMLIVYTLAVIALMAVAVLIFINQPSFGRTSQGERLERIMKSPHYKNGAFENLHEAQLMTSDKGLLRFKSKKHSDCTSLQIRIGQAPLKNAREMMHKDSLHILVPEIGEVMPLTILQ